MRQVVSLRSTKLGVIGFVLLFFITLLYWWLSNAQPVSKETTAWLLEQPFAHRGLHCSSHPENSLGAFQHAVECEYGIELDVQVTKDGQVVVFHDNQLERMTGVKGKISQMTYEQLQTLRLQGTNESIPLLTDVLHMVDGQVGILLEIKFGREGQKNAAEVYEIIEQYEGDLAVQSFDPIVLRWFEKNAPEVVRGQIGGKIPDPENKVEKVLSYVLDNLMVNFISHPNFLSYDVEEMPHFRVQSLREDGIPILGWTVRDDAGEEKAEQYCDNIIFE